VLDIQSSNGLPLVTEAHQSLSEPLPVAGYGGISVTIENHDARPGHINMVVVLTDSTSKKDSSLYLGQQPIEMASAGNITLTSPPAPGRQVLRFGIPGNSGIHHFDGISVLFLPEMFRARFGPKVAIRDFELLPR
jgi:hypothetical protein